MRVYGFLTSLAILTLLYLILARSRFGRSVRATIQNPVSAELLGIDPQRVAAIGFGLSVATATAAGAVYGIVFSFNPGSHYDLISRLLTIIVLGGLGSLGGAVVASLVVGVSESVLAAEISPTWASLTFFLVLIAVLILRPQGLFGRVERGRALSGRVSRLGLGRALGAFVPLTLAPLRVRRALGRQHRDLRGDVRRARRRPGT